MVNDELNIKTGLTALEQQCMDYLGEAYGAFLQMERQHPDELREYVSSMHRIQDLIAVRVARRAYPTTWPTHK